MMSKFLFVCAAIAATVLVPAQAAAQAHCPGTRLQVLTPPLSADPYVSLEVGGKMGLFLIDYGATASSVEPDIYSVQPNASASLAGPVWPGIPAANSFLGLARGRDYHGIGRQQGVIGTDLLRRLVVEMHFENPNDLHMVVAEHCNTSALGGQGFWRYDQHGFFTQSGTTGTSNPNVPVLRLDLGDGNGQAPINIDVPAQIDPGYRDSDWPHSVDINDAMLARLRALHVQLTQVGTTQVQDCAGQFHDAPIYITPNRALRVEDAAGGFQFIRRSFYLLHKGRSATCGGIGTMTGPAAQLGSSFLFDLGTIIFDPEREAVWVRSAYWRPSVPAAAPSVAGATRRR